MQTHADVLPPPVERVGEPQCRQASGRSVANAFAGRLRALRHGLHYLRALRELDGLADHDLRDLRIPRADVSRIAWDEAWHRMDAAA